MLVISMAPYYKTHNASLSCALAGELLFILRYPEPTLEFSTMPDKLEAAQQCWLNRTISMSSHHARR